MENTYQEITEYIKKTLNQEENIKFLEWVHIPCLDYPLIARVTPNDDKQADKIEMHCEKYLEQGLMVIVRPADTLPGDKTAEIVKKPQKETKLSANHLPLEIKDILTEITLEAVDWLAKKKIQYTCFYEIMYEDNSIPVFNVIKPKPSLKKSGQEGLVPELKKYESENREVQILPWAGLNDFLNLIYLTHKAHQKNKALINYLKNLSE